MQHLYLAAKLHPFGSHTWSNLGTVLVVVAARGRRHASTELLCEAVCAHELAGSLTGGGAVSGQAQQALEMLHAMSACATSDSLERCFERRCGGSRAWQLAHARSALRKQRTHGNDVAVRQLCQSERGAVASVTVQLPVLERQRGALSAASALILWSIFRVCGVVAIPAALSVPPVDRVRLASDRHVASLMPMIEAYKAERRKPRARGEAAPTLEDERVASRDKAGMRTLIVPIPPPARAFGLVLGRPVPPCPLPTPARGLSRALD